MAYVVARRGGRFEIRESFHTPNGPRSRTLKGFDVLTEEVLAAAAGRARRPFDAEAVLRSGRQAGARVRTATPPAGSTFARFVAASKNMAGALEQAPPIGHRTDAGEALRELLGFADVVVAGQPPRLFEPLAFPVLASLVEKRGSATIARP